MNIRLTIWMTALLLWLVHLALTFFEVLDLRKQYQAIVKQIEIEENHPMQDPTLRKHKQEEILSYLSAFRVSYQYADILSELHDIANATLLTDISPRLKEKKIFGDYERVRLFLLAKGKFHSIAKFIDLLEQKENPLIVRVHKLTIKRDEKNPKGDLLAYMEIYFYKIRKQSFTNVLEIQE